MSFGPTANNPQPQPGFSAQDHVAQVRAANAQQRINRIVPQPQTQMTQTRPGQPKSLAPRPAQSPVRNTQFQGTRTPPPVQQPQMPPPVSPIFGGGMFGSPSGPMPFQTPFMPTPQPLPGMPQPAPTPGSGGIGIVNDTAPLQAGPAPINNPQMPVGGYQLPNPAPTPPVSDGNFGRVQPMPEPISPIAIPTPNPVPTAPPVNLPAPDQPSTQMPVQAPPMEMPVTTPPPGGGAQAPVQEPYVRDENGNIVGGPNVDNPGRNATVTRTPDQPLQSVGGAGGPAQDPGPTIGGAPAPGGLLQSPDVMGGPPPDPGPGFGYDPNGSGFSGKFVGTPGRFGPDRKTMYGGGGGMLMPGSMGDQIAQQPDSGFGGFNTLQQQPVSSGYLDPSQAQTQNQIYPQPYNVSPFNTLQTPSAFAGT